MGALANLDWCREIRNQYAHCNWGWEDEKGLFFVNLEELALHPQKIDKLMINERRIDVALLRQQENFFFYVKETFYYLKVRIQRRSERSRRLANPVMFTKSHQM